MKVNYLEDLAKDKFFTVKFIKKNKELRTMNCRFGVKKHLKGGLSNIDNSKYMIVFDTKKREYRAINRETIQYIKCCGLEWNLKGQLLVVKNPELLES